MRRITRYAFYLSCCLLLSTVAMAQTQKVTGKVIDQDGHGIPGASVSIKGTTSGAIADETGVFSINVTPGSVLVFSSTGYNNSQLKFGPGTDLSLVTLTKSNRVLDEVVVTALGQPKSKARIGYSVATFNSDVINKNGAVGPLDGLAGKVAGAEITTTGGTGSSTKVVLRGNGVVGGGDNAPLYVVDGVPLSDARFASNSNDDVGLNNDVDFGDGLDNINPNDIESITVLKGTAASSLYGGLAKNGAIMITTKKGKAGKLKVEYDGSLSFSTVGKLPEYESEFGQGWGGVFVLSENGSWGPRLDGQQRLWGSVVDNSQLIKPFSAIKDPLRQFYDVGNEVNNSISVSGGTDASRFYFSYGNVYSDGIIPTKADYFERHTFALRTNSTYKNFTINTSFNYVTKSQNAPSTGQNDASQGGGVFESLLQIPVDLPIKDFRNYTNKFFDVNSFFSPYGENPYFGLNENGDHQDLNRFFGNLDLNYKLTKSLSAEYRLGGDFANARTHDWNQPNAAAPGSWRAGGNVEGFPSTPDVGSDKEESDFSGILNMDLMLKLSKPLGHDFGLDALVGANYYRQEASTEAAKITNLTIPGFFNLSNTSGIPTTADGTSLFKRVGLYAEATASFKDMLYLTGDVRDDWSSTLPIANNSIFYPGVNGSWIISKTFDLSDGPISLWKLRAGYGRTGADPAPYQVNPILTSGAPLVSLPFGSIVSPFNGVSAFRLSNSIANPALKPIFTDELEIGTDMSFFKNRLGFDLTAYHKITRGQIFTVPIAPSTGYSSFVENLGTVRNEGIELTLNATPVQTSGGFTWSFSYTFSRNWNEVLDLVGSSTQNPLIFSLVDGPEERAVVGKSAASIYAPVPQRSPDGKVVVNAQTGLPVVNTDKLDSFGNQNGYYGSGFYDYDMGFSNTFSYKNFSLSFSLDFRHGGVMYSETASQVLFTGNGIATTYNDRKPFVVPNSVNAVVNGSTTTYVPNTTYVGNTAPYNSQTDLTFEYYNNGTSPASLYPMTIFDRSFLKLRDINFSYTIPAKWASKIGSSSATIGLFARNILLWTPKSNVYIDPEATNLGNDLSSDYGEFATAPLSQQYGLIVKCIF